jgi:hypothetical protein
VTSQIRPIQSEWRPEKHWVQIATTPTGKAVYRERVKRSRGKPARDENGDRVFAKHRETGQRLYPINEREDYMHEKVFYCEQDGRGNVYKIAYNPPTADQIAAAEREGRIDRMMRDLAETFVDSGMTPQELLDAARRNAAEAQEATEAPGPALAPTDDEGGSVVEYPVYHPVGRWQLSDGSMMQGNKEAALEAEAAVQAQRAAVIEEGAY